MQEIRLLKEPGYIRDLIFVFMQQCNGDFPDGGIINENKRAEDLLFFQNIAEEFAPVSEELLIFFYRRADGGCFFPQYYYEPYRDRFARDYGFQTIQQALTDTDALLMNLIRFYFPELTDGQAAQSKASLRELSQLIGASDYPDRLKYRLTAFFIDPQPVTRKLMYELSVKEVALSKYYEKNGSQAQGVRRLGAEELQAKLKIADGMSRDLDTVSVLYLSPALILKNAVELRLGGDAAYLVLGTDYEDYLAYLADAEATPAIDLFGKALGDASRVAILDLLSQRGEMSSYDIAQAIGKSMTATYYHLETLQKANVLHAGNTRKTGKTIYYSLNRKCFRLMNRVLRKYADE